MSCVAQGDNVRAGNQSLPAAAGASSVHSLRDYCKCGKQELGMVLMPSEANFSLRVINVLCSVNSFLLLHVSVERLTPLNGAALRKINTSRSRPMCEGWRRPLCPSRRWVISSLLSVW